MEHFRKKMATEHNVCNTEKAYSCILKLLGKACAIKECQKGMPVLSDI